MFPAAVPPVKGVQGQEAFQWKETVAANDIVAVSADSLPEACHPEGIRSVGWRVIKRLGRGGGDLLEAYEPGAVISYPFTLLKDGDYLLELHRYPSLNSVGQIRVLVQVDDGKERLLESASNDEWRGNWEINTLDQVDKLYLELPKLCAGSHEIHFRAVDRYFAFSGFVLYPFAGCSSISGLYNECGEPDRNKFLPEEKSIPEKINCIRFLSGDDTLSGKECVEEAQNIWYSELPLSPRPLIRARWESGGDSLGATDVQLPMEEVLGEDAVTKTTAEELLAKGKHIFKEYDGIVRMDAFSAWGQTPYAYTSNDAWDYCASETCGRTGIAMHIQEKNRVWNNVETAPTLHYRFSCTGGSYMIWALTYVTCPKNGRFALSIDDTPVASENLYRGGNLWKYEAEHIWRLTPIAKVELPAGEHLLSFSAFASGFRVERFVIE